MAKHKHTLTLPEPLDHQQPVLSDPARFKLLACGRRWGKSTLSVMALFIGHGPDRCMTGAIDGGLCWYVAPSYKMAQEMWRLVKRIGEPVAAYKSEQDMRIELITGGVVAIKSADNPDSMRGVGLDGVVVDECAYMDEAAWTKVLRPALADKRGWGIIISTPKGYNWFHTLFLNAETSPGWQRWQQPTHANPIVTEEELTDIRKDTDSQTYAQEYLAQFVSPEGSRIKKEWFRYFRKVGPWYVLLHPSGATAGKWREMDYRKITLVDPAGSGKDVRREKQGKPRSYTAIGTFLIHKKEGHIICDHMLRDRLEVPAVCDAIEKVYGEQKPDWVGIENQGLGLSVFQLVNRRPVPLKPLRPRGRDKVERAGKALVLYEQGKIYHPEPGPNYPWLRDLENELLMWTGHDDDTADQVDVIAYAAMEATSQAFLDSPTQMHVETPVPHAVRFKRSTPRFSAMR